MNSRIARSPPSLDHSLPTTTDSNRRTLKWYSSIDRIFHPTDHFIPPESTERFYLDLYLLKPDKDDLKSKLEAISVQNLLGVLKQNVNDLIGYAIKCLKIATNGSTDLSSISNPTPTLSSPMQSAQNLARTAEDQSDDYEIDQIRLLNALETLSVVLKTILSKEGFENVNLDLITLTAGSIANSDPIFSDFVESIDKILSDRTQSLKTRHRTLQLALSVVSGVNQGSINAYFLRRDLFNTIASLIASPQTVSLIFDSVILLDLLANFRRFESRNPYLVRMEDYVDEKAMERIISLTILALEDLTVAYHNINNPELSPSLIGQVTSTVLNAITGPLSRRHQSPARPVNPAFDSHPGRPACILLPIYDLLCSNSTFFNVLVSSKPFWEQFLSFSSYLLSHASSNPRSELYGRLVLVIFIHLAEEGQKVICGLTEEPLKVTVEFCRHRQPPLGPSSDLARIPIAAMLDCGVLYLRHNLQRKLKIDSHVVCLRLIHELLFCLQSNQVRLEEFEWRDLWRAIFSLASRVGSRIDELKDVPNIDRLAQQILDILSFAAIWSEILFKDNLTIAVLYFEILRSEETIKNLITVANFNSSTSNGGGRSNLGVSTIESVKNLNTILSKSKWILEQSNNKNLSILSKNSPHKSSIGSIFSSSSSASNPNSNGTSSITPSHPTATPSSHSSTSLITSADDCLNLLQLRLAEIGLIDSASLDGHLRKYSETERMNDLKKFIDLITKDVYHLMVL